MKKFILFTLLFASKVYSIECNLSGLSEPLGGGNKILISVLERPILLPNSFVGNYYPRLDGGFDVEYVQYQTDQAGVISSRQNEVNTLQIQEKSEGLSVFNKLVNDNEVMHYKCGTIEGMTFYQKDLNHEFAIFYNKKVALTLISSEQGMWKEVFKAYFSEKK